MDSNGKKGAMPKQARPSDAPSLPNQSQPVQMDSNQNSRQTVRPLYPSSPLQQAQGAIRKQFQPKGALPYPDSSPSVKRDSNQNSRETSSLYPSLQEAQRPTQKPTTEDRMLCPYCNRKVKKINLDGHLAVCLKVRHPCVYCNKEFSKEEIKYHVAMCESNPDSIHKQKPEKIEIRNTSVAHPPQDHGGRRATVGPANGNTSNGARPPSEVLNTSKTNPPQDRGGRRGNERPVNRNTNQADKPPYEALSPGVDPVCFKADANKRAVNPGNTHPISLYIRR